MILKFTLLILLLNFRNVLVEGNENFVVVSVTERPSDSHDNLEERLRKIEHYLGNGFNQSINQLQEAKDEIVAKFENILDNKLKAYDEKRMSDFENMKKEIFALMRDVSMPARDCKDLQRKGHHTSGIYRIRPELAIEEFLVWCDMTTNGGGWTYVMNRFDGSQDFYRNWTDYKQGFGKLSGEHWLGLDHLYYLTNSKRNDLLFELIDWDSKKVRATYDNFKIENDSESYEIASAGAYSGDAEDSFRFHVGNKFATRDRDTTNLSCATELEGGWWYGNCYYVHLTGRYVENPTPGKRYWGAIQWRAFHGYNYSLKEARMMIRPVSL